MKNSVANTPPEGSRLIQTEQRNAFRQRVQSKVLAKGDVAWVELTQHRWAVIDLADFHLIAGKSWSLNQRKTAATVYAATRRLKMHRVIVGLSKREHEVDHRDGDGLNNRRGNLRVCTHQRNMQNTRKCLRNTTGFKGVSPSRREGRYEANIRVNKKRICLGHYGTPELAYAAYLDAASLYFGEFARAA